MERGRYLPPRENVRLCARFLVWVVFSGSSFRAIISPSRRSGKRVARQQRRSPHRAHILARNRTTLHDSVVGIPLELLPRIHSSGQVRRHALRSE